MRYYVGALVSAVLSAVLGTVVTAVLKDVPSEQQIEPYFPIVMLVAGLLMYLFGSGKVREIGRLILFATILAVLIAIAPSTARLLPFAH